MSYAECLRDDRQTFGRLRTVQLAGRLFGLSIHLWRLEKLTADLIDDHEPSLAVLLFEVERRVRTVNEMAAKKAAEEHE